MLKNPLTYVIVLFLVALAATVAVALPARAEVSVIFPLNVSRKNDGSNASRSTITGFRIGGFSFNIRDKCPFTFFYYICLVRSSQTKYRQCASQQDADKSAAALVYNALQGLLELLLCVLRQ